MIKTIFRYSFWPVIFAALYGLCLLDGYTGKPVGVLVTGSNIVLLLASLLLVGVLTFQEYAEFGAQAEREKYEHVKEFKGLRLALWFMFAYGVGLLWQGWVFSFLCVFVAHTSLSVINRFLKRWEMGRFRKA